MFHVKIFKLDCRGRKLQLYLKAQALDTFEVESNENLDNEKAELVDRENRCVKANEVAAMLNVRRGSAHHIVEDILHCHNVGSQTGDS
jgi:hypothetical protein